VRAGGKFQVGGLPENRQSFWTFKANRLAGRPQITPIQNDFLIKLELEVSGLLIARIGFVLVRLNCYNHQDCFLHSETHMN
jgi:hypothetical protein